MNIESYPPDVYTLYTLLKKYDIKMAVAESATGGLFTHLFTNISGASSYLKVGIVCYSAWSKMHYLGVSPSVIEKYGTISEETVNAMLDGLDITGCHLKIAITGVAGAPIEGKPHGLFYIGTEFDPEASSSTPLIPSAERPRKIIGYMLEGNRKELKLKAVINAYKQSCSVIEKYYSDYRK